MNLNLVTIVGQLAAPIGSNNSGHRALFAVKSNDPGRVDLIPVELSSEQLADIDGPRAQVGATFHIVGKLIRRYVPTTGRSALVVVATSLVQSMERERTT